MSLTMKLTVVGVRIVRGFRVHEGKPLSARIFLTSDLPAASQFTAKERVTLIKTIIERVGLVNPHLRWIPWSPRNWRGPGYQIVGMKGFDIAEIDRVGSERHIEDEVARLQAVS